MGLFVYMDAVFDVAIIGGGPAGSAAAVYAARKRLKTILIVKEFGGQSVVSPSIENWIGTPTISGHDLAEGFKKHVTTYAGDVLTLETGKKVTSIANHGNTFTLSTDTGNTYSARSILIATGADRRRLEVPGAKEFENKGVVYCASCDGPLFSGQDVAVVGGGNAGFETAAQLLAYCNSVTLLQRSDEYKADAITVEKVLADPKMKALKNVTVLEIHGEKFVNGLSYTDKSTGTTTKLPVTGVFVEVGLIPSTAFAEGVVDMDEYKRITIDPWTQMTSVPGIWAAGDCTNVHYHQNNIAAGDGVRALEDIYMYLKTRT